MKKPLGKTYLIQINMPKEEYIGNIYIPETSSLRDVIPYIGKIVEYGAGFSEEEKQELLPLGTTVLLDYSSDAVQTKIRLIFGSEQYYVYDPKFILGIIEEKE